MEFDIVAEDARGRPVLLVEVRAKRLDDEAARSILSSMKGAQLPVRFGMVADLSHIRLVDYERGAGDGFACVLDSADMLRCYDPEFETKRIFWTYLTTLVDAWLRDHVYHWKSETPPGSEQLAAVGLAQCLENGDTRREVLVGTDPLR